MNISSILSIAKASAISKPREKAFTKSAAFWRAPISVVSSQVCGISGTRGKNKVNQQALGVALGEEEARDEEKKNKP